MKVVAVIQARMGSSRLPGKVLLPLPMGGKPVLEHVVRRVNSATEIDTTVVATSEKKQDDIIAEFAPSFDCDVYRGAEADVLGRMYEAARQFDADVVVRITADCPLVSPSFINHSVHKIKRNDLDYLSAGFERTFPRGVTGETFTFSSFKRVGSESEKLHQREHVTPYYRENPNEFNLANINSEEVFDNPNLQNRDDLRLTLDESADFKLFNIIYSKIEFTDLIPLEDAVQYIDSHNISRINSDVRQKKVTETEKQSEDEEIVGFIDSVPITEEEKHLFQESPSDWRQAWDEAEDN